MGGDHSCYTCGRLGEHTESCPRRAWGAKVLPGQESHLWVAPAVAEARRVERNRARIERGERGALGCPDRGTCHHECERACWRVFNASPLTVAGWGDRWPADVRSRELDRLGAPRDVQRRDHATDLVSRMIDARDRLRSPAVLDEATIACDEAVEGALRLLDEGIEEGLRQRELYAGLRKLLEGDPHVCTCGAGHPHEGFGEGCSDAFEDRCRYERALRTLLGVEEASGG